MLSLNSSIQDCTITSTFYVTLFEEQVIPELAEVTVIEMEGWKLYECHLLSPNTFLYLGWDEGGNNPEWIEGDEEAYLRYYNHLVKSLMKDHSSMQN